jgi:hypothetical protein
MSEHVHLSQSKRVESGYLTVRTIVRCRFAETEEAICRELGYEVEVRYCGDPLCLGPEPGFRPGGRA